MANLTVNGEQTQLETPATVAELLTAKGLADKPCAVEVNKALVPKREHANHQLEEGDTIEIVTLVGGG